MDNYTLVDLERDVEDIINELSYVRASKGHDYSGTEDTLENLRGFGWTGVVVRMGDKFHRMKNYVKSQGVLKIADESIEDTLMDMINYSLFALIMYRQERQKCLPEPEEDLPLLKQAKGIVSYEELTEGEK